jgi:DNA-binding MarR family transcriptional regulator
MNRRDEVSDEDYRRLAELRYRIRRFQHFSEQAARAAALEPQQHQLLLAIRGLPAGRAATVGELAERLQLHHHSAVGLVDRLERAGFVSRRHDAGDRRRVLVGLTPRGDATLRELSRVHLAELRAQGRELLLALTPLLRPTGSAGAAVAAPPRGSRR